MARELYVFQPHSMVDIITNSSSELFIFKGKDRKILSDMIREVYPNYQEEYYDIKNIMELTIDELNLFIEYNCGVLGNGDPSRRENYALIGDYTFDELYEPDRRRRGGRIRYKLRDNYNPKKEEKIKKYDDFHKDMDPYDEEDWSGESDEENYFEDYFYESFVTKKNRLEVINKIDPKHQMYFLFSIGDNPNWEYQEKLSEIGGKRYHLG